MAAALKLNKETAVIKVGDKVITENFFWKSSLDMKHFMWRIAKQHNQNNYCERKTPITSMSLISCDPNISNVFADDIAAGKNIKGNYLTFNGEPTDEFPEGQQVTLKFSTSRGMDIFRTMLTDWREAATLGF